MVVVVVGLVARAGGGRPRHFGRINIPPPMPTQKTSKTPPSTLKNGVKKTNERPVLRDFPLNPSSRPVPLRPPLFPSPPPARESERRMKTTAVVRNLRPDRRSALPAKRVCSPHDERTERLRHPRTSTTSVPSSQPKLTPAGQSAAQPSQRNTQRHGQQTRHTGREARQTENQLAR